MPVISNRLVRRERRGDRDFKEVTGAISVTARVGSYPSGSFGLNHLSSIVLSVSSAVTGGVTRRGLVGSIRDPETTYRNSVLLRAIVTGTTGTRNASGPSTVGSTLGAGSAASGYYIACGW